MSKNKHIDFSNFYATTQERNDYTRLLAEAEAANHMVENGTGVGSEFLGWVNLPSATTDAQLQEMETAAAHIRRECDVVVVVGIGGSFLGTQAVDDALQQGKLCKTPGVPEILYAGNSLSADYLYDLIEYIKERRFGIVVISKSGTTTEPAISFRILKKLLEEKRGIEKAREVIIAVTDSEKGALHAIAVKEGYKTFPIADNIGGRYSVLSPVGLLPLAIAGIDIHALIDGARDAEQETSTKVTANENIAIQYAAWRQALYSNGKKIEILASYNPKLQFVAEWWKQLYGESEGKGHKGLFPTDAKFSTDLHAIGQWIQDGERTLFETVIEIKHANHAVMIPFDDENIDGLNYLSGKDIEEVNAAACEGTMRAHAEGNVPLLHFSLPELNASHLGALLYTFERACAISGYMMGVNPFDQPGVEAYKKNLFHILGKPGY